jgi:hypothetical protein
VGFDVESIKSGVTGPDPDTETAGHRVEAGSGDTGKSGLDAEPHRIWRTRSVETPERADSINQDTESGGLDAKPHWIRQWSMGCRLQPYS